MVELLGFPDDSRIWIYASDRYIPDNHLENLQSDLAIFTKEWQSHQIELSATSGIFHHYFIILVVDDSKNPPGGCSIDKSVHFLKEMELKYGIALFHRNIFYYLKDEKVHSIELDQMSTAYQQNLIDDDTLFFDHLVRTKGEFIKEWLKPLKKSWHKKFISYAKHEQQTS